MLAYKNLFLRGQKPCVYTCCSPNICYTVYCMSPSHLTFSVSLFSFLFYFFFSPHSTFSLFLLPSICFPFCSCTPFTSYYYCPFFFLLSLCPSFFFPSSTLILSPHASHHLLFAYLSPITPSLPPHFIIPSLYWCSCRNETWL